MLNKFTGIGRLSRDPEVRSTASGQSVCNFSIATTKKWTDKNTNVKQESTEWINIVCWSKLAEICGQYLSKGSLVYVEGALQTKSWEDKNGGGKRYKTDVVITNMIMLGGGQRNESQSSGSYNESTGNIELQDDPMDGDQDIPF